MKRQLLNLVNLYKIAMQARLMSTSNLSPFLFHFYNQYNALTKAEKGQYT
jgi:hypothetical protein